MRDEKIILISRKLYIIISIMLVFFTAFFQETFWFALFSVAFAAIVVQIVSLNIANKIPR